MRYSSHINSLIKAVSFDTGVEPKNNNHIICVTTLLLDTFAHGINESWLSVSKAFLQKVLLLASVPVAQR